MRSIFIYFFCIVGFTIWFAAVLNHNQADEIKFTPPKIYSVQKLLDNKVVNLINKLETQQKINELDTQSIKENLKIIKTKQTQKNEFNYQNHQRYYAEWH